MTHVPQPCHRLFVLLTWNTQVGAAVTPVGVLAVEYREQCLDGAVSWMPLTYGAAATWRRRIATADLTAETLQEWQESGGTDQLTELPPWSAATAESLAEAALDRLLTGTLWEERH